MSLLNIVTIPPSYHRQIENGLKTNENFECEIFGERVSITLTKQYSELATVKRIEKKYSRERTVSRDLQSVLSAIEILFQSNSSRLSKPTQSYLIARYDDEDRWTDAEIATVLDVAQALFDYSYIKPREEIFHDYATNLTLFTCSQASKDSLLKIYCFDKNVPVQISWRIVHINGTSVLLLQKDGTAIDYCTLYDLSYFIDFYDEVSN